MSFTHPSYRLDPVHLLGALMVIGSTAMPATGQEAATVPETADSVVLPTIVLSAGSAATSGESLIPDAATTGTKTATPLAETPQAISIVPRAQFEAQGASLMTEALRYTPGVLAESNGYDVRYDWYYIRGFEAYGTTFQDGLSLPGDPSAYATPAIDPYTLERVEVIKGPASVLYGQIPPGGLVNLVSKRPEAEPRGEVYVQTSTFGGAEVGADVGGKLSADGSLTYRLIGVGKNMGSQIDRERNRRVLLSPSLTWKPTDATTLTVYGTYQRDREDFSPRFYPAYGTLLPNPAGEIPRDLFLGDPSADGFNRTYTAAGYALEHQVNDSWTVRQNLRYARSKQDMLLVLVNPAFAYPGPFPGVPGPVLNRVTGAAEDELRNLTVDSQAEGRFTTGAADHTVLVGIDYEWLRSSTNFGNSVPGVVPGLDYTNPQYGGLDITKPAFTRSFLQERRQLGIYAQDQVEVGRWTGVAALRWDQSRLDNTNRIAGTPKTTTRDDAVTGRLGVMYRLDNGLSPYASYSTSFQPLLGTDAAGDSFEATTAKMFEVGFKYAPSGSESQFSASLYSMTQRGYLTPDPANPLLSVQGGKRRVNGLEVEGK